ncbi:MAG: winged helix-turn-helix domain-containing protein [Methanocellales archaeon]|nr:winged helix-turn-helix domain-containing protein [Methanocellales archaeon]MDD3292173.1 winged helix-turn-helix domain-containing protein [Methanocellales archaeon]MDD5235760.1 winged helix-turn-helix domain-containing protein [Methanocellales archaeon]MDD5485825.1 winged helix-turn-helix domain-containing protein [Methanocellales archaeon]
MCASDENEKKRSKIVRAMLRLAACSDLRSGILVSLKKGKKPLSELRDEMEASSTTAIHALRELEKGKFIFQDEAKDYVLTKIGEIVALKLLDFLEAIDVLEKYEGFWRTHDLSDIPEHLLERIGALRNSSMVEAPAADVLQVFTSFVDILRNAKEIRGVTSMSIPDFGPLFKELTIEKNIDVELIISEEVLGGIDQEILKEIFSEKSSKLKLYVMKKDLKVAFTVTDSLLSLGLFNFDGTYDWNKDIVDSTKEGIEWGWELFEWYRKRSNKFHL